MLRGIVAAANSIAINGTTLVAGGGVSAELIRFFTLYWDRVVIPSSMVDTMVPDEDVLIAAGALERPFLGGFEIGQRFHWNGAEVGRMALEAQLRFAEKLLKEDSNTEWVIHQSGTALQLPEEVRQQKLQLRMDLVDALPVPLGTVPVDEILEFKHRRKDALSTLHDRLDDVYLEVLRSPDTELSTKKAVRDLLASIADIEKSASENWSQTKKFTLSPSFNLDVGKLLPGIAAGQILDAFANPTSIPIATVIGGFTSMFSLKVSQDVSWSPAEGQKKLSYLSHAHKEGILKPKGSNGLKYPLRFNQRVGG